jgi:hypothetical protein
MPSALLVATLYALYALQSGGVSSWPCNAVQPVMYFYQMASLLSVEITAGSTLLALVGGLSNMQVHAGGGDDGFACPFSSLTTVQAIELQYAVPAVVALLLALGYCGEARCGEKQRVGAAAAQVRAQYGGALARVATLAYSTALVTTFQLLHCVEVDDTNVLFQSAVIVCGVWQAPFYVMAAALLLPVVMGLAAGTGVARAAPLLPRWAALVDRLRAPYREGCEHWEAVLALHRLAVVVAHSFTVGSAAATAVLQTLLCGVALAVHLAWKPFRDANANRAQTALLSSLVVVAQLNVPQAAIDTNALAESDKMKWLLDQLKSGEAALLLAPAVLVGAALLVLAWRKRRALARQAAAGCAALARCPCALWACACGKSAAAAGAADEEAPLTEALLAQQLQPGDQQPRPTPDAPYAGGRGGRE